MSRIVSWFRALPGASSAAQMAFAGATVLSAWLARMPFEPHLQGYAPYSTFFVAILVVAWFCRVPATVAAVALSFAISAYVIIPPAWSWHIADREQAHTLVLFVAISTAMVLLSRAASAARHRTADALGAAARAQQGARAVVWDVALDPASASQDAWPQLLGLHEGGVFATAGGPPARIHPEDEAEARAALAEAIDAPHALATEFRIQHPVFGERWLSASGDVQHDAAGRPVRLSGITLDVTERHRAEQERALLAAIVASSDDAIIGKSLGGTILSWNAGAERLLGYGPREVLGKSIEILVPASRHTEEREIIEHVRRGEPLDQLETVRIAKDGREIDVALSVSPIRDHRGTVVGASSTARDIRARKRAERALASQREWFRVTLTSIGDGVITTDREGRVTFLNPISESLTGWSVAEAEGRPLREVFRILNEQTREPVENPAEKVIRSGRIIELANHTALVARDGTERPVADSAAPIHDDRGEIIGAVLVFRDVTEDRRVEEALAEQREWLETTLRSIGDAVIATDAQGRISFMNPIAERLTGWSAPRAQGRPCAEVFRIVNEDTRQEVESPVATALSEGKIVGLANHSMLIAADGTERPIDDSGAPIWSRDGRIVGAVLVFRDVSDRRRVERERAHAAVEREQLLESERLARSEAERANHLKDEFIATLSHELRTPLNAILGWTQVLRTTDADDSTLDHALDVIERNTRAQAQLVSDLLDMSRMAGGRLHLDMQRLDLADVVRAALDAVRATAEQKDLRIDCEIEPGLGPVVGDPARLEQILWNLLSNAIKFTPRGGRVSVALRQRDDRAEIAIRDTGIGIKPQFLPHLFERFRQGDGSTSRRFGGLGLGLAIVKQLADLHGAEVFAESDGEERGATFYLRIPLSSAARRAEARSAGRAADRQTDDLSGIVVLLVEDEADTRDLMRRLLEDAGARVLPAADGSEALELLRRGSPDLLLSDIGLPGMDGYELLRRIRADGGTLGRRIPAVAITAFARSQDRTRALAAGYQSHLVKPVEPQELIATVASLAQLVRRSTAAWT